MSRDVFASNTVTIAVGDIRCFRGIEYRIVAIQDADMVLLEDPDTGRKFPAQVEQLSLPLLVEDEAQNSSSGIDGLTESEWDTANMRFAAIKPLLSASIIGVAEAEARAREVGVNRATLYRWLKSYKESGSLVSLVPAKRGWRAGTGRISAEQEQIIDSVIDDFFLTEQRPSQSETADEVVHRCHKEGVKPPGFSAIRRRLLRVPERVALARRGNRELARNRYEATPGSFPGADYPLAVVQIDHTPLDVVIVDDIERKPIGRPWLTVALDVNSRVVTGYYLSLEEPSITSVAMCLSQSVLPKTRVLKELHLDVVWPVNGVPVTIHLDNAPEFRAKSFQRACAVNDINIEYRPVGLPRFGGHVERFLGTLSKEVHMLPGTTRSNVADRGEYDSNRRSALTLSELERWFVHWLCKTYHVRRHSTLGVSPLKQWQLGVSGSNSGIDGLRLRMPKDERAFTLDFLPAFERTVQAKGVTIEQVRYFADSLRKWVGSKDASTGKPRKFVFRRDPRDISCVWFFDPELKRYFEVPYADQSQLAMSAGELRLAKAQLQSVGTSHASIHLLAQAVAERREAVAGAQKSTSKVRREKQRQKVNKQSSIVAVEKRAAQKVRPAPTPESAWGDEDDLPEGFGDIA